ncbi:MAG TPA: hypothetical protein PK691_02760 [Thermomicrobiales bacterium]|nr:hypothetical protein [Thermomicrobiales bacterium]
MTQRTLARRTLLMATIGLAIGPRLVRAQTSESERGPGGLLVATANGSVDLVDAISGATMVSFATAGTPIAAWAGTAPGTAILQTDTELAVLNTNDGSSKPISLAADVGAQILPSSIQFRGSEGIQNMLLGTASSGADTFVVDLRTGERMAVIGLLGVTPPPVQLSNVAIAADDVHLLAWDGRTTWIVDLETRVARVLGTAPFTFSAGFSPDGTRLVYSQQPTRGKTEIRMQTVDGTDDRVLFQSDDILVGLWIPGGERMLLDDRTDSGGTLSIFNPVTERRLELLSYTGATSIVQFAIDGVAALVGIEGASGRDWYWLDLSGDTATATLLTDLQDAVVSPGFAFHADVAVAWMAPTDLVSGRVKGVNLPTGKITTFLQAIESDAEVSQPMIAPFGPGALLTVDSFTEFAVHFLNFTDGSDQAVDLMKGGSAVIAPTGDQFAVIHDLNSGQHATVVYDAHGNEGMTVPGEALAWL